MKPTISKKHFVEAIKSIEAQWRLDQEIATFLGRAFTDAFKANLLPRNGILQEALIKVLEKAVNDEGQWIDYYLWEIDFGKDAKRYQVTVDGKSFVLSTPGKLYDFIINLKQ